MPKKTGKAAYDEFLADVLSAVPEDQRGTIEEVLTNDAVVGRAANRVMQQSEFSRQMDALRAREAELTTKTQEWENWYTDASREFARSQEQLDAYRSTFGDLGEGAVPPQPRGLSPEDLARELARRDQMAITFADVLTDLKDEHKSTFGERLNTRELIQFCESKGLPLEAGYKMYISPRLEEKRKTEFDEQLRRAREEGASEALSRHHLPVAPSATEIHALDAQNIKTDPNERIRAAVESFTRREHHAR